MPDDKQVQGCQYRHFEQDFHDGKHFWTFTKKQVKSMWTEFSGPTAVRDHAPPESVEVRMEHFSRAIERIIQDNFKDATDHLLSNGNGDRKYESGLILNPHCFQIAERRK